MHIAIEQHDGPAPHVLQEADANNPAITTAALNFWADDGASLAQPPDADKAALMTVQDVLVCGWFSLCEN